MRRAGSLTGWLDPRSWRHMVDVIAVLVGRDHKGRYKSTFMDMAWAVASPVLFLLTFYFVFTVVINLHIPRYASYTFTAIVMWIWTQASLLEAVSSISANPSLVSQPRFPVAALPAVAVVSNLINLLLSLPLLLVIIVIEGGHPSMMWLCLPAIMVVQFILTLGLAYFAAALNVVFRDLQYILPIILQLGYFTTPIFFDISHMPARFQSYMELNPMFQFIRAYRLVLMDGQFPSWGALGLLLVVSLILVALGYRYFRHASRRFLEEI